MNNKRIHYERVLLELDSCGGFECASIKKRNVVIGPFEVLQVWIYMVYLSTYYIRFFNTTYSTSSATTSIKYVIKNQIDPHP